MLLVTFDTLIVPPPGQTTVVGAGFVTGMGYVGLNRSRKGGPDAE